MTKCIPLALAALATFSLVTEACAQSRKSYKPPERCVKLRTTDFDAYVACLERAYIEAFPDSPEAWRACGERCVGGKRPSDILQLGKGK